MMNRRISLLLIAAISLFVPMLPAWADTATDGGADRAAAPRETRSAGAILDDQVIELKVLDRLLAHKSIMDQVNISTTSYNYVLLLTGETPTEELRAQVSDILKGIPKVKRTHNEIIVAPVSGVIARSKDSWITAKVKTKIFTIKGIDGFDPTGVKVVTESRVVYLMGLVTRKEAAAITDVARRVDGVERVVKIFEYLD